MQAYPFGLENPLPWGVILKCHNNSKHWHIAENEKANQSRQQHRIVVCLGSPKPLFRFLIGTGILHTTALLLPVSNRKYAPHPSIAMNNDTDGGRNKFRRLYGNILKRFPAYGFNAAFSSSRIS